MLHFSCDMCGRQLDERRYVVRAETYPCFDEEAITEHDLHCDHLQDVAEMLSQVEEEGDCPLDDVGAREFRFDLCQTCHGKYLRDPLGRDAFRRLNFSEN